MSYDQVRERVGIVPAAQCPSCGLYSEVWRRRGGAEFVKTGCHHADPAPQRDRDGLYIVFSPDALEIDDAN